jgi:hypothetical protein
MDIKQFSYAELDLVEIGGSVNFRVSYCGETGAYKELSNTGINAQIDNTGLTNPTAIELYNRVGPFRKQYRRIRTPKAPDLANRGNYQVESPLPENYGKSFSLLIQWCGQMAVQSLRVFMNPKPEYGNGQPLADEASINIVTTDGTPFKF